jgi:hypothetical protein
LSIVFADNDSVVINIGFYNFLSGYLRPVDEEPAFEPWLKIQETTTGDMHSTK